VEAVKPERMRIQEQVAKMMREGKDPGTIFRWSLQETKKMEAKERAAEQGIPLTGKRIGQKLS
jgi:hypothetical protein